MSLFCRRLTTRPSSRSLSLRLNAPVACQCRSKLSTSTNTRVRQEPHQKDEPLMEDHREIGSRQKLYMQSVYSPGSVFFLPHGVRLLQRLKNHLRREWVQQEFEEVQTPILFDAALWQCSGHLQNYQRDMFLFPRSAETTLNSSTVDETGRGEELPATLWGMKPMNCPAHCLIYQHQVRSYRDLPLKLCDFTALHRNELSGTLTGLLRLRQFHQDDGHIFCRNEQLSSMIEETLSLVHRLYSKTYRFPRYALRLSTRPEEGYLGDLDQWNEAETILAEALRNHVDRFHFGKDEGEGEQKEPIELVVEKGAGAFYGPKIDVVLQDSLGRHHQTATLQLDFQLPKRFQLTYVDSEGHPKTPVLIHRALLGSLERFIAVWMEECQGKWPLWASPRQCKVLAVHPGNHGYAMEVSRELKKVMGELMPGEPGFVEVESEQAAEKESLGKRIREGQMLSFNYIVVVGDQEVQTRTVSLRSRDTQRTLKGLSVSQVRSIWEKELQQQDEKRVTEKESGRTKLKREQ